MWNNIKKLDTGEFVITKCELEQILEQASKNGAKMALSELGLSDEKARMDIRDLRELLKAFRIAKKDIFRISVKWIVVGIMTLITAGFITSTSNKTNLCRNLEKLHSKNYLPAILIYRGFLMRLSSIMTALSLKVIDQMKIN